MSIRSAVAGLAKTDSKWYLFVGVLSLLKAVGVRHNPRRFKKELLDAALFLSIGLLLRVAEDGGGSKEAPKRTSNAGRKPSPTDGSADRVRAATDAIRGRLSNSDAEPTSRADAVRRRLSRS
jgi:hypothetical protein